MARDATDRGLIEQQIESWVRQNVAYPDQKLHGKCGKIVLRHLSIERKPQGDVAAFPNKLEEGAEDEGLDMFLHKVADAAQQDANDLNQGVQSYALYAYYPQDRDYVARKMFRVAPSTEAEIERDLSPSEPPTERGLVSQLMRHLEAIQRTTTVSTGHLFSTLQSEHRRMAETNEKFMQQQVDFMVVLQDLLDNAHGRRLKEREDEARLTMQDKAFEIVSTLAPVIINRLAGKQVLPEEDRSLMLMSNFLERLTPEQQESFYGNLSDTQRLALAEVLHAYEERKARWDGKKSPGPKLGKKSGLPEARRLPPSSPGTSAPDPEPGEEALTHAASLRERLQRQPDASSDPSIQKIEVDAQRFYTRFREDLKPTKEKP